MAKLRFEESHLPGSYAGRRSHHGHWSLELAGDHRFSVDKGAWWGETTHGGTWRLEGDLLVLEPEPPHALDADDGMATRYVPVWWGNRHLLVTESQMPTFCADARGKAPPREVKVDGLYFVVYFVKLLASGAPAGIGAPVVPDRFRHFYERGPIRAQVTQLNGDGTVTLDKGSDDRLQAGMWLMKTGYRPGLEVEVLSITDHAATARAYYSPWTERHIAVGEELTTGERWDFPRLRSREWLTEPAPPRPRIAIAHKDTGEILGRFDAPGEGQPLDIGGDLQGADLRQAGPDSDAPLNLVGVEASYARLRGAVMEGQNLVRAVFRDGYLEGADARDANLEWGDLSDADLRRVAFAGANLSHANLQMSDLTDADLSGARLYRALLAAADLRGADLTGADLRRADLTFARFDCRTRWPVGFDPAAARRGPGRSVNARNYVRFLSNEHTVPSYEGCRGKLCILLAKALNELDVIVDPFSFGYRSDVSVRVNGTNRCFVRDRVSRFRCACGGFRFRVQAGSPGDRRLVGGAEWLVAVHPLARIGATLMPGKTEAACRTVCRRLDQILKMDPRFARIRWYTESEWNTDAEADWSEAP